MNSKTGFIIKSLLFLFVLIGVGFLFSIFFGNKSNRALTLADHEFENWSQNYEFSADTTQQNISFFNDKIDINYPQLIELAKIGEISLASELWRMRQKCPSKMDHQGCNSLLHKYILEKFPGTGNKSFEALFNKYLKYEKEMSHLRFPKGMSDSQKYNLIREKRKIFFGDDEAKLVFGFEQAKYNFRVSLKSFIEKNPKLSGDHKIAAYNKIRKQTFGIYYATVVKKEPAFAKYLAELKLRDSDFMELNQTGQALLKRELRIKYFGQDGAKKMDQVDGLFSSDTKLKIKN